MDGYGLGGVEVGGALVVFMSDRLSVRMSRVS